MDLQDLMQGGFNAEAQPDAPVVSKDPMPPGVPGNCMITPVPVIQQNKKETGYYIKIEMLVMDGPYAGRKCWDYLNIDNPSPVAEAIAKSQLKKICLLVGIPHIQSLNELMGKIVRPVLIVDGQYNNVKDYEIATVAVTTPVAVPPTSPPPPAVPVPVPAAPPTPVAVPVSVGVPTGTPSGPIPVAAPAPIPTPAGAPWAAPPPVDPAVGDIPF